MDGDNRDAGPVREVAASGPAGTVVAYRNETFHRGTELTAPRGARYTIHACFKRADADWLSRRVWTDSARTDEWHQFVIAASARQLRLFRFPPAGHPHWTPRTLAGVAARYPGIDVSMFGGRRPKPSEPSKHADDYQLP